MKRLIIFPAILILGILQATILSRFKIFNISPDILLAASVIVGILFGLRWALPLGLFAGLLKDSFSVGVFGINTLLFVLWSFLAVRLSRKIVIDDTLRASVVVFIAAILNNLLRALVFIYSGYAVPAGIYFRIAFIGSVYTGLFAPLVFIALSRAETSITFAKNVKNKDC